MTIRQAAKELGVSHVALLKAIKAGSLKSELDGSLDMKKVLASEWYKHRRGAPAVEIPISDEEEKAKRLEVLRQRLGVDPALFAQDKNSLEKLLILERRTSLQLDNEERKGNLLNAEEVQSAWAGIISATRSHLLLLPGKLGHKVAAITDPNECSAVIDKAIKEALKSLSEYQLDAA
jgi:hypothetical protein